MNKKTTAVLILLGLSVLLLFLCALREAPVSEEDRKEGFVDFDDMSVSIDSRRSMMQVYGYTDEKERHFFFLPSCANDRNAIVSIPGGGKLLLRDAEGRERILSDGDRLTGLLFGEWYGARRISADGLRSGEDLFMVNAAKDLPSAFLFTDSGDMEGIHAHKGDPDYREGGAMLLLNEGGRIEYFDMLRTVSGHGNSTWLREKKSYQIRLHRNTALLGMKSADTWLLMSNCMDYSNIRNSIAFRLASGAGFSFTPSLRYVELYLNGRYNGLYQLAEKCEINPHRLDLANLAQENNRINPMLPKYFPAADDADAGSSLHGYQFLRVPEDITGGYLIEHDYGQKYASEPSRFRTASGERYVLKSPVYASMEELRYISGIFQTLEERAASGEDLSDLIDMKSFADKYIFEELVKNEGAGATSAFFYKDSDRRDPHLYAGPVWDYDKALGGSSAAITNLPRTLEFSTNHLEHTEIYFNLWMNHPEFRDMVRAEYTGVFAPLVAEILEKDEIGDFSSMVRRDDDMDSTRWNYSPRAASEEAERIRTFLRERKAFLDEVWTEGKELCLLSFPKSGRGRNPVFGVLQGETLPIFPDTTSSSEDFDCWIDAETGEEIDESTPIIRDVTVLEKVKDGSGESP